MSSPPNRPLRAGLLLLAGLVVVLATDAARPQMLRPGAASRVIRPSESIHEGDRVVFSGDGFGLTWEVKTIREQTALIRRGKDEAFADLSDLVRAR